MEFLNDWDLQAVVRSCGFSSLEAASPAPPRRGDPANGLVGQAPEVAGEPIRAAEVPLYDLELSRPFFLAPAQERPLDHEVLIAFPAASTSGRRPGVRTHRPKRSKKSQLKKVVCEVPVADGGVSTDLWAWRKYGQKPIKGSPYPRGYYKCSSLKSCMARKMVERSSAKPWMLIVTYMAEHSHPVPMQLNALAGTTRHRQTPPDGHQQSHSSDEAAKREDSSDTLLTAGDGSTETADDENEFWPVGMELEEFLGPLDDDLDHFLDDDGVHIGRRLSLQ